MTSRWSNLSKYHILRSITCSRKFSGLSPRILTFPFQSPTARKGALTLSFGTSPISRQAISTPPRGFVPTSCRDNKNIKKQQGSWSSDNFEGPHQRISPPPTPHLTTTSYRIISYHSEHFVFRERCIAPISYILSWFAIVTCIFCIASSSSKNIMSPPAKASTTWRSLAQAFSICFLPGARHSCGGCPVMITRSPCEYTCHSMLQETSGKFAQSLHKAFIKHS